VQDNDVSAHHVIGSFDKALRVAVPPGVIVVSPTAIIYMSTIPMLTVSGIAQLSELETINCVELLIVDTPESHGQQFVNAAGAQ
jgi:hypothetical protein